MLKRLYAWLIDRSPLIKVAGFALALGLLGVVAWLKESRITRMQEAAAWAAHTHEVRASLNRLLSSLEGIETGERGFLLTADPAYLEPFEANRIAVNGEFRSLCALTSDNPRRRVNCDVLAPLITRRIARSQANVDLRRNVGFEVARQAVAGGEGKAIMDQTRAVIAQMEADEQALLGQRSVEFNREARIVNWISMAGYGLSFSLVLGLFALTLHENLGRQRAQVQLDRFFTLSLDMLGIAGMNGYFKRLNPAFSQTLGYTTDELLARPFLDFVHPDDRASTLAEVEKLSQGVATIQFENRYQCQDGSWRWLSWKSQPVVEEGLLYAAARDITELRRAYTTLDHFFTLSVDPFCVGGFDGYFKRVNSGWSNLLGWSTEELLAQPFLDVVHPDDREGAVRELANVMQGALVVAYQLRCRCRDGSYRWLEWSAVSAPDEQEFYAVSRDVTERREAEERISRLNADLRVGSAQVVEINKELESFAYSVSHDLSAPLRSIDGFSQVLLEGCADRLNDEGKDALQRVRKATTTMGELIDALLALSRVSRVEFRAGRVDLSALAATVAAELRRSQPDRQVEFVIAPGMVVEADPGLLRAMLVNLLDNAWKYTQPRLVARLEFGCFNRYNETVYFVRDNGVGFDMTYVDKLFGAFQRLHRQTEFAGTGVGLATVQRIVHRHGGRAWAEGAVDHGATFYFTLSSPARSNIAAWENAETPARVS